MGVGIADAVELGPERASAQVAIADFIRTGAMLNIS
jgi:hypothetical protein